MGPSSSTGEYKLSEVRKNDGSSGQRKKRCSQVCDSTKEGIKEVRELTALFSSPLLVSANVGLSGLCDEDTINCCAANSTFECRKLFQLSKLASSQVMRNRLSYFLFLSSQFVVLK